MRPPCALALLAMLAVACASDADDQATCKMCAKIVKTMQDTKTDSIAQACVALSQSLPASKFDLRKCVMVAESMSAHRPVLANYLRDGCYMKPEGGAELQLAKPCPPQHVCQAMRPGGVLFC